MTKTKCRLDYQRFKIGKQVQHFLTNQPTSFTRTLAQTEEKKSLFQRFTVEIHLLEDYSFNYYLGTSFNALNWWPNKFPLQYKTMKWTSKVFSPLERNLDKSSREGPKIISSQVKKK